MNSSDSFGRLRIPSNGILWSEKYRPINLKEVVGQEHIVSILENLLQEEKLGTRILLFLGPSGSGKTCTAEAFINECRNRWPSPDIGIVRIDCSQERSSFYVRHRIRPFLRTAQPKILLLENIDSLTKEAQVSLASVLQSVPSQTIVIMTALAKLHVEKRLLSVAIPLHFCRLTKEQVKARLFYICEREGMQIDERQLDMIAMKCEGDLRAAINMIQSKAPPTICIHKPPPLEDYVKGLEVGKRPELQPIGRRVHIPQFSWSEVIELIAPKGRVFRVQLRPLKNDYVLIKIMLPKGKNISFSRKKVILSSPSGLSGSVKRTRKALKCSSLRFLDDTCYIELSKSKAYIRSMDELLLIMKNGTRTSQSINKI
jgi:DNA polymerase III delta prime subunit